MVNKNCSKNQADQIIGVILKEWRKYEFAVESELSDREARQNIQQNYYDYTFSAEMDEWNSKPWYIRLFSFKPEREIYMPFKWYSAKDVHSYLSLPGFMNYLSNKTIEL